MFDSELLFPQTPEELDDSDFETEDFDVRSRTSIQTEDDQLIAGQSARVRTKSEHYETLTFLQETVQLALKIQVKFWGDGGENVGPENWHYFVSSFLLKRTLSEMQHVVV